MLIPAKGFVMRGIGVSLGVLAALMGTATLAQAQQGGLSATGGGIVLSLPTVGQGVVTSGDPALDASEGLAFGVVFGADGYIDLGQHGDYSFFLGASGFAALASGSSSTASTLSGSGALIIPGYTTPTDFSIDLSTASGGGSTEAHSNLGQTAVVETNDVDQGPAPGAGFSGLVNPGGGANDPSFLYGGIFYDSDDDRSAAFGAVADEDGNIMIAVGDLTGVVVTQDVSQNIIYYGGDLTPGFSAVHGNMQVSGYAGPSYLFLGRDVMSTTTVDFPELGDPGVLELPFYSLTRDETLETHYLGGVVGGSVSSPVGDGMILSVGAEGGLYYSSTTATGMETASVFGGNPAPATDPTEVANLNALSLTDSGMAFSVQGNAALTMPLSGNTQISFGTGAEYLSSVASLSPGTASTADVSDYGTADDDGTVSYSATEDLMPMISYDGMWNLSGFVTFSGQF